MRDQLMQRGKLIDRPSRKEHQNNNIAEIAFHTFFPGRVNNPLPVCKVYSNSPLILGISCLPLWSSYKEARPLVALHPSVPPIP